MLLICRLQEGGWPHSSECLFNTDKGRHELPLLHVLTAGEWSATGVRPDSSQLCQMGNRANTGRVNLQLSFCPCGWWMWLSRVFAWGVLTVWPPDSINSSVLHPMEQTKARNDGEGRALVFWWRTSPLWPCHFALGGGQRKGGGAWGRGGGVGLCLVNMQMKHLMGLKRSWRSSSVIIEKEIKAPSKQMCGCLWVAAQRCSWTSFFALQC